jgi:phosphoribosylaminoimidazole-succinocarboxamide synthase
MLDNQTILDAIPHALTGVDLPNLGPKSEGKVRDIYQLDGQRVLITTDRVSAFDRVLGAIPFKGQVLNQLSAWWFKQARDIVANHVVSIPDPNVTLAVEAETLPVEVIVRGYLTGVTKTSLWYLYSQGERQPYGIPLPDGMRQHDALPNAIITPTTKATGGAHDEQLTRDQIVSSGLVPEARWREVETAALGLFARGQDIARRAGLILVDTKYEFGLVNGKLVLIDEVHTPDSSRFWIADTYGKGGEPENLDKEYLRLWFVGQGYRGDGTPPQMPPEVIARVAARYIDVYERLTGTQFVPGEQPAAARIERNLAHLGV